MENPSHLIIDPESGKTRIDIQGNWDQIVADQGISVPPGVYEVEVIKWAISRTSQKKLMQQTFHLKIISEESAYDGKLLFLNTFPEKPSWITFVANFAAAASAPEGPTMFLEDLEEGPGSGNPTADWFDAYIIGSSVNVLTKVTEYEGRRRSEVDRIVPPDPFA